MAGIQATTGLISGIDIGGLVDALVNAERAPARRLETRLKNTQAVMGGIGQLQAQLLSLSTTLTAVKSRQTFTGLSVQNAQPDQLSITSRSTSIAGNYQFQTVQTASTQRSLSRGFANPDTQQLGGSGQLVISRENSLTRSARLELLNDAQGVQRGVIRLTDRSGASANVDLSNAVTLNDVISSIRNSGLGIEARSVSGHLVLTDTTGQTSSNLTVADVGSGKTAADLGIRQSVASATLTGQDVFKVTEDFSFNLLNDGNTLRNITGAADLLVTLADGTAIDVNLDGAATIGDVIDRVELHAQNGGKLAAELQNGRLVLTDNSGGAGAMIVANLNHSNAREVLGLAVAPDGNVLTGQLLSGGNSVLLRNLNGGQGIAQPGEISLTDRTGATATIDLTHAETLDDVLEAINTAQTDSLVPLQLKARLNSDGTGIEILDTSGSTSGPLIIEDVNGGTLANDLGIAVNDNVTTVNSGSLRLRTVSETTSLSTYSPRGTAVSAGAFRITDSLGNQAVINITSSEKTVGDVIDRINAASGLQITARLNDTGDGIVIVDDAGGAGTLKVEEAGGRTAEDLRLLGQGAVGASGSQEISGRRVQLVDIEADDTLNDIMAKVNSVGGTIKASIVSTGAAVNGYRLSLTSTISGTAGSFRVEDSGMGFQFANQDEGRDAVLRVGSDPATGFLLTSGTNTFSNVPGNFDITVKQVGTTAANVTAALNQDTIVNTLQSFVTAYNAYVDLSNNLTKYDAATQTRSALQGTSSPLTIMTRFSSLVNSFTGEANRSVRSLSDVGIRITTNGKLSFDTDQLKEAVTANPDQVLDFFTNATNGFGKRFEDALNGFNDQYEGSLTMEYNALQGNSDDLTARIAGIDARLELRRTRLETQFANMESALSGLQSQQSSLTNLSNILANLKSSN